MSKFVEFDDDVNNDRSEKEKKIYLSCPKCNTHYKCQMKSGFLENFDSMVANILMEAPCGHKFVTFIDKKFNIRDCIGIDYQGISIELADAEFLKKQIAKLEKEHDKALEANYNEAFEIKKKVMELKRDLEKFGKGLRVK